MGLKSIRKVNYMCLFRLAEVYINLLKILVADKTKKSIIDRLNGEYYILLLFCVGVSCK